MPISKYKAKAVFWDRIRQITISREEGEKLKSSTTGKLPKYIFRFDSTHEFLVHRELIRIYGEENVFRQYPLKILPPGLCYPYGKTWKVDFLVINRAKMMQKMLYVEAKGILLPETRLTIGCLERYHRKDFEKLRIVFPNALPLENQLVKTISATARHSMLLTLPQLKKATCL